ATVKILGGLVTGKAGISIDWKTDCLEGHGNLSVANLATISAGFKINSSGSFMVQGTQSVDLTKYGLGVAYNSNIMVQYIKDNTSTNDYYAVWTTQEFFGKTFSVGVKFDYNGNWTIVNGSEINSELKDHASERSAASQCSWQINGNGETVLLTVNTTSPDLCVLTDGNGKVYYGIDSISANAGKEFELVSSTDSGVTIAVKASKAGTWSLESFDASATYTGIVLGGSESLAAKNAAATLSNDRTVVIDCGVPESGTEVSIYCDNDASGYNGEYLGNVDSTGKLTWKITNPDAATYSFYAVSSSDNALPVMGKYSNAITVDAIETQVEASDGWTYVGENQYISGASISGVLEVEGGSVRNGLTLEHGAEFIGSDATLSGKLIFGGDVTLRTLCETNNADVVFDLTERSFKDDFIINNKQYLNGIKGCSITVSSDQKCGTYKLMSNAADVSGTMSLNNESGTLLRTLTVNGKPQEINGRLYELTQVNGELTLSVQEKAVVKVADTNLLSNGVSQILAWDSEQGKVGYMATNGSVRPAWKGVWEWSGAEADLWRVAGVGHFKGSEVDYDGVLLYNGVGNRFAAWTDLRKGSYGYVNLCKVDGSFNTQCLANLDGDQYDDILIYDTNGSIGVVLGGTTYKDIFHVNEGDFATWTIEGAGSFDDGMDKLVMVNNYNHQVYLWTNQDTSFATWNWKTQSVGKLESGWEVAAVGDFEGDGIDDIMVLDRNTNNVWIWDDGNSQTKRWRGTLGEGFEIEASGDYNGDGCADLLLREHNTGWGGMGYWGNGYAGNWVDLKARIETDLKSSFDIIA
ncbi:MAG: VCBS repeat-containing protein, partial [Lentisphaerae bacterium]|nr:VCBS repeat-containing protein [Lentisphaerota bacterium]